MPLVALLLAGGARAAGPAPASVPGHDIAWIWLADDAPSGEIAEAAVLMESLVLHQHGVTRQMRMRDLPLPRSVSVTPVVHVQAGSTLGERLDAPQRDAVIAALKRHAARASSGWVQLDFEAPTRLREDYIALVARARRELPAGVRLSVTALASWCGQGDWLDRLAADEVVPMLYRLGPQTERWRDRWLHAPEQLHARCRGPALGLSVQEPPSTALSGRASRRYWFNEQLWSRATAAFPP